LHLIFTIMNNLISEFSAIAIALSNGYQSTN
jgi:hypothetical protein